MSGTSPQSRCALPRTPSRAPESDST
jgi:hypothetical protein